MIRIYPSSQFWIFAFSAFISVSMSCNRIPQEEVSVEDGIYLVGSKSLYPEIMEEGRFSNGVDVLTGTGRSTLFEKQLVLPSGKEGFQVVRVQKGRMESWGPGPDFSGVLPANLKDGEPVDGIFRGSYVESESLFTVAEDGLYHVILDTDLQQLAIARMKWGIDANPGSGGSFTYLHPNADTGLGYRDYSLQGQELANETWHFNYSGGERLFLGQDYLAVSCILGGSLDSLTSGGDSFLNSVAGLYDIYFYWDPYSGYSAETQITDTFEISREYPEELFLIGEGVGGWDFDSHALPMIPVLDHPNAFWRIVWLEPVSGDSSMLIVTDGTLENRFGVAETTLPLPANMALGDLPIPGPEEAGYFLVWIDLETDSLSISVPEVYLVGEVVDGIWDPPVASARFFVDNENQLITLNRNLVTGYLRMHVWHPWHYHWWQHEFVIRDENIEYRGRGKALNPVKVTGGSKSIELDFREGTGTILQSP